MAAPGEDGSEAALVQTKSAGAYPTIASAFYACSPVRLQGSEVEGAGVTFVPDSSRTIFAFNLGTKAPPLGTKLIAHACGGRWTFRYDG
jgi:hypothetical protein